MEINNIFEKLPDAQNGEKFDSLLDERSDALDEKQFIESLLKKRNFNLTRIVSKGQATPEGQWDEQDMDEWFMVVKGSAGLKFKGEDEIRVMNSGDYIILPAHCPVKVEWTDQEQETIWLALHYNDS